MFEDTDAFLLLRIVCFIFVFFVPFDILVLSSGSSVHMKAPW